MMSYDHTSSVRRLWEHFPLAPWSQRGGQGEFGGAYGVPAFSLALRGLGLCNRTASGSHFGGILVRYFMERIEAQQTAASETLGHKDIDITLQIYRHVMPKEHEDMADRIERMMMGE
jgi:integrase